MKISLTVSSLFLAAIISCFAGPPTAEEIADFSTRVSTFVRNKDFAGIQSLYFNDGTPPQLIEKTMKIWEARVVQPDPNWTFVGVEYFPLSEYLTRPNVNKNTIENYIGERDINGTTYLPNTPVIGLLSVKFTTGMNQNNFIYPVGYSPGGKLCFVGKKAKS